MGEVPYCFWGHLSNFKVTQAKKINVLELRVSEFVFWRMGHGWVVKTLAKTVGGEGVSKIPGGSTLASTSWSNSLLHVIGILPCCLCAETADLYLCSHVSFIQNNITSLWIHRWLWNNAQSLKRHSRGALFFLAATKQLYKWYFPSVCLSVCPSVHPSVCHTFFTMFPSSYHPEILLVSYYHGQEWCPCKRSRSEVKGQGHRGQYPT